MQTIIDELLHESFKRTSCVNGSCNCRHCNHQRSRELNKIQQELQSMELDLSREEELELGRMIARAKELVKKGVGKASPVVRKLVWLGQLIANGVNPSVERFYEEEKRRRMQAAIEQAQTKPKHSIERKPDKESSVMQELLTETGI